MLLFEVDEVTCKVTAAHDSNVLVLPFTVTYAFTQQGANWLHYIESGYYITCCCDVFENRPVAACLIWQNVRRNRKRYLASYFGHYRWA